MYARKVVYGSTGDQSLLLCKPGVSQFSATNSSLSILTGFSAVIIFAFQFLRIGSVKPVTMVVKLESMSSSLGKPIPASACLCSGINGSINI